MNRTATFFFLIVEKAQPSAGLFYALILMPGFAPRLLTHASSFNPRFLQMIVS